MESVMTNLPMENTSVDEELTPSPWPAPHAMFGNGTRPVKINTNLGKQLFNVLITDNQCFSHEKHFSKNCNPIGVFGSNIIKARPPSIEHASIPQI
jgi:hypothetical protein